MEEGTVLLLILDVSLFLTHVNRFVVRLDVLLACCFTIAVRYVTESIDHEIRINLEICGNSATYILLLYISDYTST